MKQGAGRCLAVLVLAFLAVILVAAPPEHRAEAQVPNTPATGEVIVTGTARVGETLTADASSIADADGLSDRNFTLVWLAGATSDPSEATWRIFSNGERYHVDPRDAGLMVMVAAHFFDDAGNAEEVVSAPTAVVAPTAPGPPVNLTASSKAHGNLSVSWLAPFWRLEDWLADRPSLGDGGSDITGYKVQWKLSTGSWTVPADVSEETVDRRRLRRDDRPRRPTPSRTSPAARRTRCASSPQTRWATASPPVRSPGRSTAFPPVPLPSRERLG